jgi:hypothetical protein
MRTLSSSILPNFPSAGASFPLLPRGGLAFDVDVDIFLEESVSEEREEDENI